VRRRLSLRGYVPKIFQFPGTREIKKKKNVEEVLKKAGPRKP